MQKSILKRLSLFGLILFTVLFSNTYNANATSSIENEFKSVIEKYDINNVIVENGISLKLGEVLELSDSFNWNMSNSNTIKINKQGQLEAINEGTVFLSKEYGDKVYILEVYVYKDNYIIYSTDNNSRAKYNYKVFIDPGHGGSDPGAIAFGRRESDINLQISLKLRDILESKGIEVVMSRTKDVYLSLEERSNLANKSEADVFISIHQNSFTSESANGIETYYHTDKTSHKTLSTEIQNNLISQTNANNRGVKYANFVVLRLSNMTSALVECGFISNQTESGKLVNGDYQNKIATGIANGVDNYLKSNITLDKLPFTDITNHWAKNQILSFAENGYINGYEDKTFRPDNGITRAEFIKIVNNYFGFTQKQSVTFKDVNSNAWYYNDLQIAVKAGYINGYEDNTFRPDNNINREEVAKIINSILKLQNSGQVSFKDSNDISSWAKDSVYALANNNIINGYEDNTFRPKNSITRAESVTILSRVNN